MSDFDKEAEREKLREKYERDEQERQATQRMSDLLLKGATMTNAHCGTCGDPLFQMDGTTFCPSCHGNPDAVEGTDLEAQSAAETPDATADEGAGTDRDDSSATGGGAESAGTDAASQSNSPSPEQRHDRGVATDSSASDDSNAAADTGADAASAAATDRRPSTTRSEPTDSSPDDSEPARRPTGDARGSSGRGRSAAGGASRSADGDLETARDSLVAALEKFAEKAAATDDPRYAKECLEAAREAGETLETLR